MRVEHPDNHPHNLASCSLYWFKVWNMNMINHRLSTGSNTFLLYVTKSCTNEMQSIYQMYYLPVATTTTTRTQGHKQLTPCSSTQQLGAIKSQMRSSECDTPCAQPQGFCPSTSDPPSTPPATGANLIKLKRKEKVVGDVERMGVSGWGQFLHVC